MCLALSKHPVVPCRRVDLRNIAFRIRASRSWEAVAAKARDYEWATNITLAEKTPFARRGKGRACCEDGPGERIMREYPSDVAFTPSVKAIQSEKGSRQGYARMESSGGWETAVTPQLRAFLADLDMFYLGTASKDGQPYLQYRGGPPGFLKAIDEKMLAFADFGGNRQYITLGNLSENPKAFIFLMDYAHSRRIKLWGTAKVVENDAELLARLRDAEYPGKVERAIVFTLDAWDVNCPRHIHKRFSQRQISAVITELQARIAELENQLERGRDPAKEGTSKAIN